MHKIKKIIAKNIYNVFAIKSYSSDTRKNEKSHWNLKVAANQEPVCLSSGSSSASRFRTGEAGAVPNGDFGGAAPKHLQEEPELFFCFGGAPSLSACGALREEPKQTGPKSKFVSSPRRYRSIPPLPWRLGHLQVPKHRKMAWKSWSTPSPGRVHPTFTATKATPKRKKRNRPAGGPQRNLEARKNLPSPSRSSPAPRQADPTIILPTWSPLARKKSKENAKENRKEKGEKGVVK